MPCILFPPRYDGSTNDNEAWRRGGEIVSPGSYEATLGWTRWFVFLILALRRLRQKDPEFEASMNYIGKPSLPKQTLFISFPAHI